MKALPTAEDGSNLDLVDVKADKEAAFDQIMETTNSGGDGKPGCLAMAVKGVKSCHSRFAARSSGGRKTGSSRQTRCAAATGASSMASFFSHCTQ